MGNVQLAPSSTLDPTENLDLCPDSLLDVIGRNKCHPVKTGGLDLNERFTNGGRHSSCTIKQVEGIVASSFPPSLDTQLVGGLGCRRSVAEFLRHFDCCGEVLLVELVQQAGSAASSVHPRSKGAGRARDRQGCVLEFGVGAPSPKRVQRHFQFAGDLQRSVIVFLLGEVVNRLSVPRQLARKLSLKFPNVPTVGGQQVASAGALDAVVGQSIQNVPPLVRFEPIREELS